MNVELLLDMANFMEGFEDDDEPVYRYNQAVFFHSEPRVADEVIDQMIAEEDDSWCGTQACIAGTAALLAKAVKPQPIKRFAFDPYAMRRVRWVLSHDFDGADGHWDAGDPAEVCVQELATGLMGLQEWETRVLFDGGWLPAEGMSAPEALRKLAFGVRLSGVTNPYGITHLAWALLRHGEQLRSEGWTDIDIKECLHGIEQMHGQDIIRILRMEGVTPWRLNCTIMDDEDLEEMSV